MTSARKHKTRHTARRLPRGTAPVQRPPRPEPHAIPAPAPPAEGWKLMSTSVPHLHDAPWGARLALAAVEKFAILAGVGILGAGLLAAALAGSVPSLRSVLLRWLLALV